MKQIIFALSLTVLPAPAAMAQDESGLSLMERGAQLFLEGILKEVEPAIDDLEALSEDMGPALRNFIEDMGPAFSELRDQVTDWTKYEAPEILPNGDIILRRKTPEAPLKGPPKDEPPIDL